MAFAIPSTGPSRPSGPARRALAGLLAVTASGGAAALTLLPGMPAASAAPNPCAASEIARTIGSVADDTGAYLEAHPRTNQALTIVAGRPAGPQSMAALATYFDANPEAAADMQEIQAPLATLANRCNLPISLSQVLGLVQAAQKNGLPDAAAGAAPGPTGAAQAVSGTADTGSGTGTAPTTSAPTGQGRLPGPAGTASR